MSGLERARAARFKYDPSRPALLFCNDAERREHAEAFLMASGVRLAATLSLADAPSRLDDQASLGLAWLELGPTDDNAEVDQILIRLNNLAETRATTVIAAAPLSLVDLLASRLTNQSTEILIEPDDSLRLATLALARTSVRSKSTFHDVGKDDAARILQLSNEMGRIAATLARLSMGPEGASSEPTSDIGETPAVDVDTVRAVIRARRLRSRYFSPELFADPAWDMLLELLQAEIAQMRVPVSSLCVAAAVPATTALRWIKSMTEQGLFLRRADPHDGRRMFIELAPTTSQAMRRYFGELGKIAALNC